MLRYVRDSKNLGLKYYSKIEDAHLSGLLIKSIINYENQLVVFSDPRWQDCPDTERITVLYILFYQVGPIDHFTHVPGPFPQSSAESEYNAA